MKYVGAAATALDGDADDHGRILQLDRHDRASSSRRTGTSRP